MLVSLEKTQYDKLLAAIRSMDVLCPICVLIDPRRENKITVEWEEERDDMGYVISRSPSFLGKCRDDTRDMILNFSTFDLTRPLNHAEQLNKDMENGNESPDISFIMGQLNARRQLAHILGVTIPR